MQKFITYNGKNINIDDHYDDYIKNGIITEDISENEYYKLQRERRDIIIKNYMKRGYTSPVALMMYEMYKHFCRDCKTISGLDFKYEKHYNALSFYIMCEEACTSYMAIETFKDLKSLFLFNYQQHKKHIEFDYRQALLDIRAKLVVGQKFLGGYELTKNDLNTLNAIKI